MIIKYDMNIKDFDYWSGAKALAEKLTDSEWEQLEEALKECYPDGMTETELNDTLWFSDDWIAGILQLEIDEIYNR